jgi:CheY-like chemotaxis protein
MNEEILKGKTLLVVDDEADLRDILASELEFMGAKVFQAENVLSAQRLLSQHHVDLIVSDIRMPGGSGIDLLEYVKSRDVNSPLILITGFADITAEYAFNKGAEAIIHKPFKLDDMIKLVIHYTAPFEKRFTVDLPAQKLIQALDETVHLGRGGLSLPVDTLGKRIDVGDSVEFEVNVGHHRFTGRGICRWLRPGLGGKNKSHVGVEFMNLDGKSRSYLEEFFQENPTVAYIPAAAV